ncbi:unnamed protein product [Darwinula stevensoni]|uniref:Uncharacterized protein n=1 Tax=Darwinula stevensoni TaxID=69355 RepID=A0A7R8ZX53_9CRUS|nr:unnamed protein product [Darwinula stevensoni]CAG0878687.1 unnamed protein product [Darwinula stevensoni]
MRFLSLFLVSLVGFDSLSAMEKILDPIHDGIVTAQCRIQCLSQFLGDREFGDLDGKCRQNKDCNMCWEVCQLLESDFIVWGPMCGVPDICFPGCMKACIYHTDLDLSRHYDGSPVTGEYLLPGKLKVKGEDGRGQKVVAWEEVTRMGNKVSNRDARNHGRPPTLDQHVVYAPFIQPFIHDYYRPLNQTTGLKMRLSEDGFEGRNSLLLLAVGKEGVLARAETAFVFRGGVAPRPSISDFFFPVGDGGAGVPNVLDIGKVVDEEDVPKSVLSPSYFPKFNPPRPLSSLRTTSTSTTRRPPKTKHQKKLDWSLKLDSLKTSKKQGSVIAEVSWNCSGLGPGEFLVTWEVHSDLSGVKGHLFTQGTSARLTLLPHSKYIVQVEHISRHLRESEKSQPLEVDTENATSDEAGMDDTFIVQLQVLAGVGAGSSCFVLFTLIALAAKRLWASKASAPKTSPSFPSLPSASGARRDEDEGSCRDLEGQLGEEEAQKSLTYYFPISVRPEHMHDSFVRLQEFVFKEELGQLANPYIDFLYKLEYLPLSIPMMRHASRELVISILILWQWAGPCDGADPSLVINPEGTVHHKPLGQSLYFQCRPNVENVGLVSEWKWFDPHGMEITGDDRIYTELMIDGETGISLNIEHLEEKDQGEYRCEARYSGNVPLRQTIEIQTFLPITWIDAPKNQYATLGQKDARITCIVQANPVAMVDWQRDREPIRTGYGGNRFRIVGEGIIISGVENGDEGAYTCRARVAQTGQLEERIINFSVYRAPTFIEEPKDTEGVEGESLEIKCRADGNPSPTYTWLDRNNANLNEREGYKVDLYGTLQIASLKREDEGSLTCVAENSAENGRVHHTIQLAVVVKPRIEELLNISRPVNGSAEINCKVSGKPLPEVEIRKLSSLKPFTVGQQEDDPRISFHQREENGMMIGTLYIEKLTRADDGLYGCTASNIGSQAYMNGHIEVQFAPVFNEPPNERDYFSWERRPINLTCIAESIPNATIQWFFHGDREIRNDAHFMRIGEGPKSTLQVTPEDPVYYAKYRCEASNLIGKAIYEMDLKEAFPPGRIDQAAIETATATTITWKLIGPRETNGLEVDSYVVEYRKRDESWSEARRRVWNKGVPYILENLEPREIYMFRFAAQNSVGLGDWGEERQHTMDAEGPPQPPPILGSPPDPLNEIDIPEPYNYDLRWEVPPDNGKRINEYEVTYFKVKKSGGKWEQYGTMNTRIVEQPGPPMYKLQGLDPNTYYKVEVRARNEIGLSQPGSIIIKTADDTSRHRPGISGRRGNGVSVHAQSSGSAATTTAAWSLVLVLVLVL